MFISIFRYAKIEINVSDPIVPFRETIAMPPKLDMVNEAVIDNSIKVARIKQFEDDEEVLGPGLVEVYTPNRKCCIRIRAIPLPEKVTSLLEDNQELLKTLHQCNTTKGLDLHQKETAKVKVTVMEALKDLKDKIEKIFSESGKLWRDAVNNIWAFGPKRVGPNVLLNRIEDYCRPSVWDYQEKGDQIREYDNSIVSGFQMATIAGPLCEEPMRGLCFIVEKWNYEDSSYLSIARLSESENVADDISSNNLIDSANVNDSAVEKNMKNNSTDVEESDSETEYKAGKCLNKR